jgi:hypothetical protein
VDEKVGRDSAVGGSGAESFGHLVSPLGVTIPNPNLGRSGVQ